MLYKKTHRQYLREWRLGRRFKYRGSGDVGKVATKPNMTSKYIWVAGYDLISLVTGKLHYKDRVTWLD